MKHFVQYHNTEKRGKYAHTRGEPFYILTNKPVSHLTGSTLWLIAGQGEPRTYSLCCRFVVGKTGATHHTGFQNFASGMEGMDFDPAFSLDPQEWFEAFRKSQQN